MTQMTDGPAWVRVSSIPEIAEKYARDLEEKRAEAHSMIDARFDQIAREQALLLEQLRHDFERLPQH